MLPPPWLNALVIEKTAFVKGFGREGFTRGKEGKGGGGILTNDDYPCVLSAAELSGHYFWKLESEDLGEASNHRNM